MTRVRTCFDTDHKQISNDALAQAKQILQKSAAKHYDSVEWNVWLSRRGPARP